LSLRLWKRYAKAGSGPDLEYADEVTLGKAFAGRRSV